MTALLDASVLISLVLPAHVHHQRTRRWFGSDTDFATCPVTHGALVRMLVRQGASAKHAQEVLGLVLGHARHEQWWDDVSYVDVDLRAVTGHRQVTDAYLAALARARSARLATLDRGLVAAHPDVALLVPG